MDELRLKFSDKQIEDFANYIEQLITKIDLSITPGLKHALIEVSDVEYDMVLQAEQ